ncbi:hypothetical protein Tco_0463071 [Tanacetum coccineum]
MNQEVSRQLAARDEQKEETFQVIINVIKNSTCYKAFTISAKVPEIFMQQFWYTVKKVSGTNSYEFILANKKSTIQASQENVDYPEIKFGKNFGHFKSTTSSKETDTLKFVRISEDYQEYGLLIPKRMLTDGIKQLESYHLFIKYSTGLIPPQEEQRRVVKKKVSIFTDDNIIPDPDVALELGKSISLTKAAEEEAVRQVHATHARIT